MDKKATTLDEQIQLMRSRGIQIDDEGKAKEYLMDIGYYRLGFYMFPYEKSYPNLSRRTHEVVEGTRIEDAVRLYYFDYDLHTILSKYLRRIEVALRTKMIYEISNRYPENPVWFVDPEVIEDQFIRTFDEKIYTTLKRGSDAIKHHHKTYPRDTYAPAWKAIEFMTFGSVECLYNSLIKASDKNVISRHFGIKNTLTFSAYLMVCRHLRNICAHGGRLFDYHPHYQIATKPASLMNSDQYCLSGCLKVVSYLLGESSHNRKNEMMDELGTAARRLLEHSPRAQETLLNTSHINLKDLASGASL